MTIKAPHGIIQSCYDQFAARGDPWLIEREKQALYPSHEDENPDIDRALMPPNRKGPSGLTVTKGTPPRQRPPSLQLYLIQRNMRLKKQLGVR